MSRRHRNHRFARMTVLALASCALIVPSSAFAAKIGDTPADFPNAVALAPAPGDTPADFPGASRAPRYQAPTTIQVVRPERTVVRDVDEVLPIVLSSAALLLALCGVGVAMARSGSARRRLAGRVN